VHNCFKSEIVLDRRGKHRLERKQPVTVVIGAKCAEGAVILYADRNVIGTDGSRTEGFKIWSRDLPKGPIAIASATDDAVSSENLASNVLTDFKKRPPEDFSELVDRVRGHLTSWNQPYAEELNISHLMAASLSGEVKLYLVQPRNKVLEIPQRYTIGAGASTVEPLFERLLPENTYYPPKSTLTRLAYMVRRAKETVAFVGGGSNAVYVPRFGSERWIETIELKMAEEMGQFVDEVLGYVAGLMLSLTNEKDASKTADMLSDMIAKTTNSISNAVHFSAFEP
jgi:hypothetical protein